MLDIMNGGNNNLKMCTRFLCALIYWYPAQKAISITAELCKKVFQHTNNTANYARVPQARATA